MEALVHARRERDAIRGDMERVVREMQAVEADLEGGARNAANAPFQRERLAQLRAELAGLRQRMRRVMEATTSSAGGSSAAAGAAIAPLGGPPAPLLVDAANNSQQGATPSRVLHMGTPMARGGGPLRGHGDCISLSPPRAASRAAYDATTGVYGGSVAQQQSRLLGHDREPRQQQAQISSPFQAGDDAGRFASAAGVGDGTSESRAVSKREGLASPRPAQSSPSPLPVVHTTNNGLLQRRERGTLQATTEGHQNPPPQRTYARAPSTSTAAAAAAAVVRGASGGSGGPQSPPLAAPSRSAAAVLDAASQRTEALMDQLRQQHHGEEEALRGEFARAMEALHARHADEARRLADRCREEQRQLAELEDARARMERAQRQLQLLQAQPALPGGGGVAGKRSGGGHQLLPIEAESLSRFSSSEQQSRVAL